MLWVMAFHIIFMVTWFCGLFYLPRLYVYHTLSFDETSITRFKIMERKLFFGIMTPGAVLTLGLGIWLFTYNPQAYLHAPWFLAKMLLVALLIIFHIYLGKLLFDFKHNHNQHGHVFYRWLNEVPVIFLGGIIILVVVKPWGMMT
jgi:protoporphyrinogen IX oxidase